MSFLTNPGQTCGQSLLLKERGGSGGNFKPRCLSAAVPEMSQAFLVSQEYLLPASENWSSSSQAKQNLLWGLSCYF